MSVDSDGRIVLEDDERTRYIWIFRKGNGQAVVSPSPAILKAGGEVWVVNKTGNEANVVFSDEFMAPGTLCVPPGRSSSARAKGVSGYFEYDVYFDSRANYAEGGSRPGVIIEH